jgi:F-type H+-transporting ATPase subunit delta
VKPRLEGYTAAVLEAVHGDDAARLAADLTAVDQTFLANPALRSALTDTAIPPAARRAVLDDLLDGKVSPETRRVASFAAGAVPAPEVPVALDWLAHRARQSAEGQAVIDPVPSHLAARERVGGFAAAVFEDLPVDRLEEVEDELFRFARTVETTPPLRSALADRDLPVTVRRGVADQLLAGKVQPATLRLVQYAIEGGRPRDILGTLFWLVDQTAEARGWRVAQVDSAREVDDEARALLSSSLGRLTGSPVELQVTVDPSLLAGVRVRIGDLQVEATARGRLEELREHMASGGWEDSGLGAVQQSSQARSSQGQSSQAQSSQAQGARPEGAHPEGAQ